MSKASLLQYLDSLLHDAEVDVLNLGNEPVWSVGNRIVIEKVVA